jgi:hypothetical protein
MAGLQFGIHNLGEGRRQIRRTLILHNRQGLVCRWPFRGIELQRPFNANEKRHVPLADYSMSRRKALTNLAKSVSLDGKEQAHAAVNA